MGEGGQGVIIGGAGPSGLATAGCLSRLSIIHIILERGDCIASLWKKYIYHCLHLKKQFCRLPHVPFPDSCHTYVPRKQFLQYLDGYVSHFNITPLYKRNVVCASFDGSKWNVKARNGCSWEVEEYVGRFLVVATGKTTNPFVAEVDGCGCLAPWYQRSSAMETYLLTLNVTLFRI